jgi:hypothetical protein
MLWFSSSWRTADYVHIFNFEMVLIGGPMCGDF